MRYPAACCGEYSFIDLAKNGAIAEKVFVISLIPSKINKTNFDLEKLFDTYFHGIKTMSVADLTQVMNAIMHPTIRGEIGDQEYEKFLETVVDELNSEDEPKQRYILSKVPEIIKSSTDANKIVGRLIEKTDKDVPLDMEIINEIWKAKDVWINNNAAKKKFLIKAESMQKKNKENESTVLSQILSELEPKEEEEKK